MRRIVSVLWAGLLMACAPAAAADTAPPVTPAPVIYAAPTTKDGIGRVMAPVWLNGQGPFLFIVDTGANRTVLSPETARELGIDVNSAARALVHGVTGSESAPLARVRELRVGRIVRSDVEMPVVSSRVHATADGMLGADNLAGTRLTVDFRRNRIDVVDADAVGPAPRSSLSVAAEMRFGLLPLVCGKVGGVTVDVVVDTGAERSIGNGALRSALAAAGASTRDNGQTTVFGAVGPNVVADVVSVPRLRVGAGSVTRLPILFADTHVFRIWQLESSPSLLLGMDVIGQLDAITIDYRRNRIWFTVAAPEGTVRVRH
jgi:predicted aspartyl protease